MAKFGNIIASLESLGETVEPMDPVEHAELGTVVAENDGDMTVEEGEIVSADDAINSAEDSVDSLEETAVAITEVGSPDEEATPLEVATTEALVSSIHKSLGMSDGRPTLESFHKPTRRDLIATLEAASEGIGSKILKAVKAVFMQVINFISGLFRSKAALKKYLEGLRAQLKDASFKTGEITAKFASAEEAKSALKDCDQAVNICNDKISLLQGVEKMKVTPTEVILNSIEKEVKDFVTKASSDFNGMKFVSGTTVVVSGGAEKEKKFNVEVKPGEVSKGTALTAAEADQVLSAAISSLETFTKMSKFENGLKTLVKQLRDGLGAGWTNGAAKYEFEKGNIEGALENMSKSIHKMAMTIYRNVANCYGSKIPALIFRTIKGAGDYVKASMGSSEPEKA